MDALPEMFSQLTLNFYFQVLPSTPSLGKLICFFCDFLFLGKEFYIFHHSLRCETDTRHGAISLLVYFSSNIYVLDVKVFSSPRCYILQFLVSPSYIYYRGKEATYMLVVNDSVKVSSARQAMMGLRWEEIEKQEPYVQMLIRFEMPFT